MVSVTTVRLLHVNPQSYEVVDFAFPASVVLGVANHGILVPR